MRIVYGKQTIELIDITNESSVFDIKIHLNKLTNIPVDIIKLVQRGKLLTNDIIVNTLVGGSLGKLTMIANPTITSDKIDIPITNNSTDIRIKNDLTTQSNPSNNQSTVKEFIKDGYGFHSFETLDNFNDKYKAKEILESLASDPGVLAVMKRHRWNVQCLGELYPEGYVGVSEVCVLGLNVNKGQKILLRLRTDDLQGFRKYLTIKKVLCHELTHNVHSEHDDNFYLLMRQIEREVDSLNWTTSSYHMIDRNEFTGRKWSEVFDKSNSNVNNTVDSANESMDESIDVSTDNNQMIISTYCEEYKQDENTNSNFIDNHNQLVISDSPDDSINNDKSNNDNDNKYSFDSIYNNLDEAFALALSTDSPDRIMNFIASLQELIDALPNQLDELIWILKTVYKIFNNIKIFNDEKVKNIKTNTKTFTRLLNSSKSKVVNVLLTGGFDNINTNGVYTYNYKDIGFLYYINDLLEMLL